MAMCESNLFQVLLKTAKAFALASRKCLFVF